VFTALNTAPPKRALIGLYTYTDEVLVLAWTEMLAANNSGVGQKPVANNSRNNDEVANTISRQNDSNSLARANAVVLDVPRDAHFVNVMGNEMPAMPKFPALQPKPGRVRGYVKDLSGKPLQGAAIGIRASYFAGSYSGAQGETNADGYYEFVVPKGSAHFYSAGYALEWGEGIAAVGLHPADGKVESFTTADGAVENFVLLPYGITSRENISQNPYVPSAYYGGSIRISYYTVDESSRGVIAGSIVENSVVELTLTPEGKMLDGTAGKTFIIRQPIGYKGNFDIHNIPLGRYRITAKTGGKPLKMKETNKFKPLFGMTPEEATGEASILFTPGDSKASSGAPNFGSWERISITVSMP
jgi:hypothetical protein